MGTFFVQETPENIQMRERLLALEEEINASGAKRKSCVRLFTEVEKEPGRRKLLHSSILNFFNFAIFKIDIIV